MQAAASAGWTRTRKAEKRWRLLHGRQGGWVAANTIIRHAIAMRQWRFLLARADANRREVRAGQADATDWGSTQVLHGFIHII